MEFTPHKLGNYLLLQRLAFGGMSEVYRAIALGAGKFQKQLAIKRILPAFSSDDQFEKMFEYEAHLASRLSHSNIVETYDFVKLDDTYLLAMEFVEGKNVRQLLSKLDAQELSRRPQLGVYLVNEVCKGLEYAHTRKDPRTGEPWNIIHRDISPENIMISYEGDVKLVDFGIARAKDRAQVTHPDIIKGKLAYMSPEHAAGKKIDHRADLFASGLVLYEMLTGAKVFQNQGLDDALRKLENCFIPLPSTINPAISPELEILVMKALAKDPDDRYVDAGAFHRELQMYLSAYYPSFIQKDVADIMEQLFGAEREKGRRAWEAACREAAALSLAQLDSSIADRNGRTLHRPASFGMPPGSKERIARDESANRNLPSAGTEATEEPSDSMELAPDFNQGPSQNAFQMVDVPEVKSSQVKMSLEEQTDHGDDFGDERTKHDIRLVQQEPSVNLIPEAAGEPGQELSGNLPPKSATATSNAIERGREVLPPREPEKLRPAIHDLWRYLMYGTVGGLAVLFLVHQFSGIHHVVREPEKLPDFVVNPPPEVRVESPTPSVPEVSVPALPIPERAPEVVASVPAQVATPTVRKPAGRRPPSGKIEIKVNRTATLTIDNKVYGRVRANQAVVLTLSSDRRHKLHFVNASNGIDAIRTVNVNRNHLSHKVFTFQTLAGRRSNRRPARSSTP